MRHTAVWLACLLALPMWSQAVSLSEPIVRSGLGQRLIAEVEVIDLERSAWPTLTAVIASPELYQEQGVEYPGIAADLSVFVLRHGDGRPYFRIVGHHPLNEPFLELMLDVGWSQGHLVRKYTILPEPPATDPRQQEGYDGLTLVEREARKEQRFRQRKIEPADQMIGMAEVIRRTESSEPDVSAVSHSEFRVRRYYVHRKENLFRVAKRWREPRLSIHQRMLALYYNNPEAFIGGNPNRLIRGHWVSTPNIPETPDNEAEAYAKWMRLVNSPDQWVKGEQLAEADETANLADSTAEEVSSNAAKNEEASASSDMPKKPASRKSSDEHHRERLVVSNGMSKEEVKRYKRLLEMENQIRKLIQEAEGKSPQLTLSNSMPGTELSHVPEEPKTNGLEGTPSASETINTPAPFPVAPAAVMNPPVQKESSAPALAAVEVAPQPVVSVPSAADVPGTPVPSKETTGAEQIKEARKRHQLRRRLPTPPLVMEESMLAAIPWWVGVMAISAAVLALTGGFYTFRRQRQRKAAVEALLKESAELADASSIFTDTGQSLSEVKASAADLAGAGSLNRESLLNVDTDTHVDPITEADVYISYERYEAAEALLKTALEQHPYSREVLWRLFDVYRKTSRPIETQKLARQLHEMYEVRDPKQRVICEVLGIEFGTLIVNEGDVAEIPTVSIAESTVTEQKQELSPALETEAIIEVEELPQKQQLVEIKDENFDLKEKNEFEKSQDSPIMPMLNIEVPPLDFNLADFEPAEYQENPQKGEHLEDGTIHSQLELAKMWIHQGKTDSARILLEAIVETGTPSQKELALALLNALPGSDKV